MALNPVVLDDLDWKGMVEAIRARIPAASDGQWTLHAPVDPGVTLLELFAWQLEQCLFRMDQVPEALNRALLAMLGARPRRTRCAATVLQLRRNGATGVDRRVPLTLNGGEPPMVYSTRTSLAVLPLAEPTMRLWVQGQERSADLARGRVFNLLPSNGNTAEVRIELALTAVPAAVDGHDWFGLWFRLRTAASIAPQWSPDAAPGVPPPASLTWLYRSTGDTLKAFEVDDGTAGLRRSGIVRLRIPRDWQAEPGGQVYALHLNCGRATYSSPPRLAALVPNAVIARHARRTDPQPANARAFAWLPLPGNVIRLDEWPVDEPEKDVPIVESACVLRLKERDGQWHRWWPTTSLHAAGPARRAFIVDRERAQLRFGDGLNGRLPVLADPAQGSNVCFRYLVGGGSNGAVGPSPTNECNWSGANGIEARNLIESVGGAEAETLEQVRRRSEAQLKVATRAITQHDFETIALATRGVAVKRAHAAIGRHPQHPCALVPGAVTVFIVPEVPRDDGIDSELVESAFVAAPMPDPGMLAAVRARLDAARLVTTELYVSAPIYRAVRVRAVVEGDVRDPAAMRDAIRTRLQGFLDPLTGGDEAGGWPFGDPVRPSVMLREVQAAAGEQARVASVAICLDDEKEQSCRPVAIGAHELVWLKELSLDVHRSVAPVGGLR